MSSVTRKKCQNLHRISAVQHIPSERKVTLPIRTRLQNGGGGGEVASVCNPKDKANYFSLSVVSSRALLERVGSQLFNLNAPI